ncbi:MAG: ABC transporter permease [Streptosporangiales bacterium]|jgi:ABC-type transport system involved in multi-copper enzyme maturation permease subunit|nr:ABC transporter permease [Streptosporangiales bacterium]
MIRSGYRQAVAMEWVKLRTLRSTTWALGLGLAASIALGVIAGYNTRDAGGDPTSNVLAGVILGQVVMGVLGVLIMTGEYSSGTIGPTLAAVPRRPLVLVAKATVFGVTGLLAGQVTTFASFLLGIAVLRPPVPHPSLGDPTVVRAVVLTGLYLALIGLAGLGIGALVRHSAASAATLVGGLFVLPLVAGAARSSGIGRFLPELIAGNSLAAVKPVSGFGWSPWLELGIVALYPAALLTAGGWLLVRRDS